MRRDILTAQDFFRYLQCPHWPYWERFGDKKDRRRLTASEEERLADGLEHEKNIVKKFFGAAKTVTARSAAAGFKQTLKLMQAGAPIIYQGWLVNDDWAGRPDLLIKQEGESNFGHWFYSPVDIKRGHELKKEHKAQLTFYALLLEHVQKSFPPEPAIINRDGERISFLASDFMAEFNGLVLELDRIRAGEIPPPVYRKACKDTSPWGQACLRLAEQHHDIALLFNVDVRKLKSLRRLGISTVEQAANLDVEALEGQEPGLTPRALIAIKRQAQSLEHGQVVIKENFEDQTQGLEIHFDIESHPPTDCDYLFGFLLREPKGDRYHHFIAKKPEDEKKLWQDFLAWLPTLPAEYTVYHYAVYEQSRLTVLSKRYGGADNPWLVRFRDRMVDLSETARDHAVFPLYFYSLKDIAKFLGFHWTGDVQSGGQSINFYDKWRRTHDKKVLNSIVQYNEEDVRATAWLLDWLRGYAKEQKIFSPPFPWT